MIFHHLYEQHQKAIGYSMLWHSALKFEKGQFWDVKLFASKAKINIFWKNFKKSSPAEEEVI